jgi:hypothetical protein
MSAQTSDDIQKQIDQLKKETDKLNAEKAMIDAQKALQDSQKALDQTKASSTQQVTDLQNQKALADAQKALADSQSQAALSKYIGTDVKSGPYSGIVTMKDKAGTEEAQLLGAQALREAAKKVAAQVRDKSQVFSIFRNTELPNFQRLAGFNFRVTLLQQAFSKAGVTSPQKTGNEFVTPAMVSTGLDAFSKILGFFKTDYEIGGTDVKLDDSLLLYAVSGELTKADGSSPAKEVHLPLIYEPALQDLSNNVLVKKLYDLFELRRIADSELTATKNTIADTQKKADDPANASTKASLATTVEGLKPKVDQLTAVIALYDAFATSLSTPDANGILPISTVAQENAIVSALQSGSAVLLLRLESSGGGYLLKKNLWTGLGGMPLFHMGGATVTYLLLNGKTGGVIAGNVVPVYGGFVRTDRLRDKLSTTVP